MLTLTDHASGRAPASTVGLVALAVAAIAATALSGLVVGSLLVVGGFATAAAVIDARSGRLPDELLVAATVPFVVLLVVAALESGDLAAPLSMMAAGAAAFCLPVLALHLAAPAAMGFGDVKLTAVLGAALGVFDWRLAVLALCVASGGTATVGLARRRATLPFGPGLVLGSLIAVGISLAAQGVPVWP